MKTVEEIKANAPDGATHYDESGDYWRILSNSESYFFCVLSSSWLRFAYDHKGCIYTGFIKPLS